MRYVERYLEQMELFMNHIYSACGTAILVDEDDMPLLSGFRWYLRKDRNVTYAVAQPEKRGTWVLMHRLLLGAESGQIVDHANGNGLDNRRENIRFATRATNAANSRKRSSARKYKGVSKNGSGWSAALTTEGQNVNLGTYRTESLAALAYDIYAVQVWGEFAQTNFE
jgi:hypothetical protein